LLRLASRVELSTAVAHVFSPVSHLGPRAIEELQKQTVNLLSFQKAPRAVFGAQLAFNLLPQLAGSGSAALDALQTRLCGEIDRYLAGRAPTLALRLLQAPVFYSLAISLYVETAVAINPARAAEVLAGNGVRVRRPSDPVSSQVEVTGSDNILINSILPDASRPKGLWIWAVADNLRLGAQNAVEIAEKLIGDHAQKPQFGENGRAAFP
jgi:aspartate-semialdehyde dehydrogenase